MIHTFNDGRTDRELFFKCDEDVPSFGAMQIVGATVVADNIVLSCTKWSAGTQVARVAFNGPFPVLANTTGSCTLRYPCQARLDDTSGDFSLTTKLGLVSGSWDLEPGTGDELFLPVCLDESNAYYLDAAHRSVWIMPISADVGVKEVYIVKVTSIVTARAGTTPGSGVGDVQSSLSGAFVIDTPTGLDLYNSYETSVAVDEYVVVVRNGVDDKFYVIPPPGGSSPPTTTKRIRGTIKQYPSGPGADFIQPTAIDPHTIENIEGIDYPWTGASELDIYNPELFKLWNQDSQDGYVCSVRCEYNETSEEWEVYAARADRVLHGVQRTNCQFLRVDGDRGLATWREGFAADWVTDVDWDSGTCQLTIDYSCADSVVHSIEFVKDVIYSEGNCELFIYKCGSVIDEYSLDFVKDVNVVGCELVINKCSGSYNEPLPNYVTGVVMGTHSLYYTTCFGSYFIAPIGPCPITSSPTCGTAEWVARYDSSSTLVWNLDSNSCSGACNPVAPAFSPESHGQRETTNCA